MKSINLNTNIIKFLMSKHHKKGNKKKVRPKDKFENVDEGLDNE